MARMLTFATYPEDPRGSRSVMAAVCEVCGKKPSFGMNISHSHRRTKRRWDPNIQKVRAVVDGSPQAPQRLHVVHPLGQGHQAPGPLHPGLTLPGLRPPTGTGPHRADGPVGPVRTGGASRPGQRSAVQGELPRCAGAPPHLDRLPQPGAGNPARSPSGSGVATTSS